MSKKTNAQLALEYEDVLELVTGVDTADIEDEDVKMAVRAVLPLIHFIERKLGEAATASEPGNFESTAPGFNEHFQRTEYSMSHLPIGTPSVVDIVNYLRNAA